MAYNTNTRLLLQFDGASATTDTSSFARACSKTAYATINTGVSPHGTGSSLYCNGKASSGNIGKVSVTAPGDLFTSSTTPWLISLHYFIEATQDDYDHGLLYFSLDDGMDGQTVSVMTDFEGALIVNAQEQVIGRVTSGGFGPSLGGPLAMGYVESAFTALETEVFAQVRGKLVPMQVVKTPFVAQRYYRG